MRSFKTTFLAVAAAFVTTASAQQDYYVNPNTVPKATRDIWCTDQKSSCPAICTLTDDRPPLVNTCDPDVLTYSCICGNNKKPPTDSALPLPFHLCQEFGNQCVAACGIGNNQCASDCREKNLCGVQSPERTTTIASTTASATASATDGVFTGMSGSSSDADNSSGSGAAALEISRGMGMTVLAGGILGGFALLL